MQISAVYSIVGPDAISVKVEESICRPMVLGISGLSIDIPSSEHFGSEAFARRVI